MKKIWALSFIMMIGLFLNAICNAQGIKGQRITRDKDGNLRTEELKGGLTISPTGRINFEEKIEDTSGIQVKLLKMVPYLKAPKAKVGGTVLLDLTGRDVISNNVRGAKVKYEKKEPIFDTFLLISLQGNLKINLGRKIYIVDRKGKKIFLGGYFGEAKGQYLDAPADTGNYDKINIYFDIPIDFTPVRIKVSKDLQEINLPAI